MLRLLVLFCFIEMGVTTMTAQGRARRPMTEFTTDTAMVHDPVMAYEDGVYYMFSTGMGIQLMTSSDRRSWTFKPGGVMGRDGIPAWTHDSVPGFRNHVWAPDIFRFNNRWWIAYSCSTFGRNTSAIGLISSPTLATPQWTDEGCVITSRQDRNNWNAIDANICADADGRPWMTFGSFWDGIQIISLDSTMHAVGSPRTIARRWGDNLSHGGNPTSEYAGENAIEAPFIFHKDGWYYLFVSWDYCCRGEKSTYRVAVGRSRKITGPYLDRNGKDMSIGGGTPFFGGDGVSLQAAGHCAAYSFPDGDIFICHGYSVAHDGAAILVQRKISWTDDGWPTVEP